jgi:hypothetical protein
MDQSFSPSPWNWDYMRLNLTENFNDDTFEAINAYKQYFGSKKAITKAMFDYFMIQIMVPCVFALALTIY